MAILKCCCFCTSLKNGSYACAVYTMGYFCLTLTMIASFTILESAGEAGLRDQTSAEDGSQVPAALNFCSASLAVVGLLTCFVLLYGLYRDSKACLIPWIVTITCASFMDCFYALYLLSITESFDALSLSFYLGDFALIMLNVYCVLCVISQYQVYCSQRTPVPSCNTA